MRKRYSNKATLIAALLTAGMTLSACQLPGFAGDTPQDGTENSAETQVSQTAEIRENTDNTPIPTIEPPQEVLSNPTSQFEQTSGTQDGETYQSSSQSGTETSEETQESTEEQALNQNKWARYTELMDCCAGASEQNLVISPLSYDMVIGMLANAGGSEAITTIENYMGKTVGELNSIALRYEEKDDTLKIANSLWLTDTEGYNPKESYVNLMKEVYGAKVGSVNFYNNDEATKKINSWVSKKTGGMITNLIHEVMPDTKSMLVNAVYFNGKFDVEMKNTGDGGFDNADGSLSTVKMMTDECAKYYENDYAIGCEKTYKDPRYKLVLILPKEVGDFQFSNLDIPSFLRNSQTIKTYLTMPKFETDTRIDLKAYIDSKGISKAVYDQVFEVYPMVLENVIQAAKIKVDEKGTEASAATMTEMEDTLSIDLVEEEVRTVRLNRPFGYIIMDGVTDIPLFMGKVVRFD